MHEKEYKKGDKVWYIHGDLLIHCTIRDIEDCFRKKHPDARLFYWLDEPVGHAVGADELYDTFESAKKDFKEATTNPREFFLE